MSPIAEAEMDRHVMSFADRSDRFVAHGCIWLFCGMMGYATCEAVHRNPEDRAGAVGEVRPTTVPPTNWATFDCKELRNICMKRAQQRVAAQ